MPRTAPAPTPALALAALTLLCVSSPALAQSDLPPRAPRAALEVPALGASMPVPNDGRAWTVLTRIDPRSVSVLATTQDAALAVTLRRARQGHPSCAALLASALGTDAIETARAAHPTALASVPFAPEVYEQHGATYDAELACLAIEGETWLATALAQHGGGAPLANAAAAARRLALSVAAARNVHGYPVWLGASGLELPDPSDDATWLFTGRADGFPLPSDAISSRAGETGGVTVTVARREGTCAAAWAAMRPAFAREGALVDRPGYVPAAFGPRIRRVPLGERLREVYCLATARSATVVTAVFGAADGDAMSRVAPLLRAVVSAAASAGLTER